MATRGNLFVISAPSGAGKTSLCRALVEADPLVRYAVSYTTRAPRSGEEDGRDYSFVSEEVFRDMTRRGLFAEWAEVHGNLYGTSMERLDDIRATGHDAVIDIDTQGAAQIRERYRDGTFVFILPPSMDVLAERLRGRATDDGEEIDRRLRAAHEEMAQYYLYDYIVVNQDFDTALADLCALLRADRLRTNRVDRSWLRNTFDV